MEGFSGVAQTADVAPRLSEVVAALSLAADLGLGQPMEHTLRSCLIATRVADALHLADAERAEVYWVTLLAMVGCTGDSSETREVFGDDIEFRNGMYDVGPSQFAMPSYFMSRAGSDGGPLRRVAKGASLMRTGMRAVMESFVADCEITGRFAERLGLGETVRNALELKFTRWDGKGIPAGVSGNEIPLATRMLAITWRVEAEHRQRGLDSALALLGRHSGATLDPGLVDSLVPILPGVLGELDEDAWSGVVSAEPARARLMGEAFDAALEALGDFADLKSPWFTGHSRAVAELSEAAAWRLGMEQGQVAQLRRAALVHSLGRTGVPNTIWDKPGDLSVSERERMRLYPYLTDRILRRGSLVPLADIASSTQERPDGSGYPRGLEATSISQPSRIVAAADVYQALCEARPHRPAMTPAEAAECFRNEVREGRLDAQAGEAVLTAAGHRAERVTTAPADLTPREVDVLKLIARGLTSAQAAAELGIAPKTVSSHLEHIYAKIGASNRSVATLFAMQHGLV